MANDVDWPQPLWQEINDAVVKEAAKVRVMQKVFPTTVLDATKTEVPNEAINFSDLSIQEGGTKPFIEIYMEFALSNTQVASEAERKTCRTLARMAAKAIALAEDTILFQGASGALPAGVKADLLDSAQAGLLGEAAPRDADDDDPRKVAEPIDVAKPGTPKPGLLYGENVFAAVADGIAKLTAKAQAANFALFLPTKVYADTYVPPSDASLVTTAERIKPLVEGGFYGTGTLPPDKGLLVALGGDPTCLYVGHDVVTESIRKEGSRFFFRVVERVQFVARDPRALVLLRFT